MNLTKKLLTASITAIALTGCMGPSDYDPALTSTPAEMYKDGCQSCHGEKGEGKFGMILKIADTEASISDISNKIEKGGHVMSSFPKIEAPQRLLLATYIKTF
ncbi:MAG: c-type cytochrome [Candidatus Sedimenticola sp. (ex Thyasira tokunagai)]